MLKRLFLAALVLLLAPGGAWAAACVTTAFAHGTGGSPFVWSGATTWATTSISGAPTACTLAAGNAVVFDANTPAGTYQFDASVSVASVDTSAMAGGQAGTVFITHNAGQTLTVSGLIFNLSANVCYSGGTTVGTCTSPVATTAPISFTSTSGTTVITTHPVAGASGTNQLGTITFNGSGGTFSIADNAIFQASPTFTAGTLTAAVANSSPTIAGNLAVPAVGIWNCGTGTWTFSSSTSALTFTAGATLSCAAGALTFSTAAAGATRQFLPLTTQAYGTVNISGAGAAGTSIFNIGPPAAGSLTIATLNFSSIAATMDVVWNNNQTTTITNLPTLWNGTPGNFIEFSTTPTSTAASIALPGALSVSWMAFARMSFNQTVTASNSWDLSGNNTGVTATPPKLGGSIIGG